MTQNLKKIYLEILNGYSPIEFSIGKFFIKHFTVFDLAEIEEQTAEIEKNIKSREIITEKEQLEYLDKNKIWTAENEKLIKDLKEVIKTQELTKTKLKLKSEINLLNKDILKNKEKLQKQTTQRAELIGLTAESLISQKVNQAYIFNSIYKTPGEKLFANNCDEIEDFYEIATVYNDKISQFEEKNLKKIAISGFFLNSYSICKENPFIFYGLPVTKLSFYQTEIFAYGRYYRNILSEAKGSIPPDISDDPDKLVDWFHANQNSSELQKNINSDQTGGTAVFGTKEDLDYIGVKNESGIDIAKELEKKGGTLSFQDIIKLHNI